MPESLNALKTHTRDFFSSHWNEEEIGIPAPEWSTEWSLEGPAPNHNKQGVYAFLKSDSVTYIGSGAGKGKKGYEGYGLGSRIGGYVRLISKGKYRAHDKRLADSGSLVTIGFPSGYGYLAISLEYYLLSRMATALNRNRPGS